MAIVLKQSRKDLCNRTGKRTVENVDSLTDCSKGVLNPTTYSHRNLGSFIHPTLVVRVFGGKIL